jgi:dTDP-4-amino-4,6-dideoxygalactose transaminase
MSSPDITEKERRAVTAVMNTPFLSMGKEIIEFEEAFKHYIGIKHAIAVSSGTAGLHLCIRSMGIKEGDYVLTTPFSFVSSTNVILFEKATPIFVDVDPATGNIDVETTKQAIIDIAEKKQNFNQWFPRKNPKANGKLKALLIIDVFGQPVDIDPLREVANAYNLKIIEDSCEALGSEYKKRKAGTLGDCGVFAFYPNKQITTGEGGLIVTNDDQAAAFMLALRNQGRSPGDTWLQHTFLGYNYRMDEMSAALGKVQLSRIDELLYKRSQVAAWYNKRLKSIPHVETLTIEPFVNKMGWFVFVIRLDKKIPREDVSKWLKSKGVPNRPYFIPIHLQPYMVKQFGYKTGDFPVTEDLGKRSLAIPFSSVMTEPQVDYVCKTLADIINELTK